MNDTSISPRRLPRSVKAAINRIAREDGIGINQIVSTAVAQKSAVWSSATSFAKCKARAPFSRFRRLLNRGGGTSPTPGDERQGERSG
jgi:hypothetical protein